MGVLVLCLLFVISCDPAATGYETKDDLVSAFVAALNADDVGQLKRTLHPACLEIISEPTRDYYDDLFEKDLKYTIPPQYAVSYSAMQEDGAPPFAQQFDYPARPTDSVPGRATLFPPRPAVRVAPVGSAGSRGPLASWWHLRRPVPDPHLPGSR